jgi:voltage-gated sodium channel
VLDKHQILLEHQEKVMKDLLAGPAFPMSTGPGTLVGEGLTIQVPATPGPEVRSSTQGEKKTSSHRASCSSVLALPTPKEGPSLVDEPYDVSEYYKTDGFAQFVVRSPIFNWIVLGTIVSNALFMGVDANENHKKSIADVGAGYAVLEFIFCGIFTTEILFRFAAFQHKLNCLRDKWFIVDSSLVVMMGLETWVFLLMVAIFDVDSRLIVTEPFKLVRLLRLARIARMMRMLPELVTLVKGIVSAMRAVFSCMVLLVIMIYVFGIILFTLEGEEEELADYFATLPKSMWTLLLNGVFLDNVGEPTRLIIRLGRTGSLIFFIVFVCLSACTVMNMLIGILCEVVSKVTAQESDAEAKNKIRHSIVKMLKRLDADGSGEISKAELLAVAEDPDADKILSDLKVDVGYFVDLQDMLYEGPDDVLSIAQIISLILECRGERSVTMQDIVFGHKFAFFRMQNLIDSFQNRMMQMIALVAQPPIAAQKIITRSDQLSTGEAAPNFNDQMQYWMYTNGMTNKFA